MKSQRIKTFFLIGIILFLVLSFSNYPQETKAGAEHNVSGYAWSENIGWISFNNTSGGGSANYGVNIEPDSVFSGYAWSEHIGWISFNESDLTGCPVAPCRAWVDISCLDGQCPIYGWARALAGGTIEAGGWDGWIRLRGLDHGLYIDQTTGEFHGWAWGGNETNSGWRDKAVSGWLSFNCAEGGELRDNICGQSDYKATTSFAFNRPPEPDALQSDHSNYCNPWSFILSWEFYDADGDSQEFYQVQVDDEPSFSSPLTNDSNQVSSSCEVGERDSYAPSAGLFSHSATYYWQVRVWDSRGAESDWVESEFTTDDCYPSPDFGWSPDVPEIGEEVQFSDESTACQGATITAWAWSFENGNPATSAEQDPLVIFSAAGAGNQNGISLEVTNSYGNSCTEEKLLNMIYPLPDWIEIVPF